MLFGKVLTEEQKKALTWDAERGVPHAMPDEKTPVALPCARFIIQEALKDDPRPLHILCMGAITDMASALLLEPKIAEQNVRVIWIGGGNYPDGGWEYNLWNDIHAANVVFKSSVEVWQIPQRVFAIPLSRIRSISRRFIRVVRWGAI